MGDRLKISDAEWSVMHVLWKASGPVEASILVAAMEREQGWNPKTTRTLIHRLEKKGAITADKTVRPFTYQPAVDEAQCQRAASHSFLRRVFHGSPMPMFANFIESGDLDDEEIQRLREMLDRAEKGKK